MCLLEIAEAIFDVTLQAGPSFHVGLYVGTLLLMMKMVALPEHRNQEKRTGRVPLNGTNELLIFG